jgi:hypothetical protein
LRGVNSIVRADDADKRLATIEKLRSSKEYIAAVADRDAKERVKDDAVANGTPDDRLIASSAYLKAKKKVSDMEVNAYAEASIGTENSPPAPAADGTAADIRPKHWAAKHDAPLYVQEIVEMKAEAVAEIDKQIADTKTARKQIAQEPVGTTVTGYSPLIGALSHPRERRQQSGIQSADKRMDCRRSADTHSKHGPVDCRVDRTVEGPR